MDFFTFLSQNLDSQIQNYTPTPLQEHAHTSTLALHSCDDSQLRVKNVEKNQKVAKSVKNPKISKLCIEIWRNMDHFLNSVFLRKNP